MNILMATADHLMIDRRILQEAKSLVEQGNSVTLLAGFECAHRESYTLDGIKIERFVFDWGDSRFTSLARRFSLRPGSKAYSFTWKLFRLWANRIAKINCFEQFVLDRLQEYQVDILHVHDYPMLAPAVALAQIRKVPLIYDAHELYYAQTQLPLKIQKKYSNREAILIHHAKTVITVNPYIAKLMADRYQVTEPQVILNAAPYRPKDTSNALRTRFGLKETDKIVLYQGWISEHRGIDRIIEAASFFSAGTYLVIVGYGDYEKYLQTLVQDKKLTDRVYFYGGVPSDELHALTCDADLGIIPYYGVDENNHFCSPNKLFEFAVAGLPMLSNNLPFLHDIITRYGNGILADLNSPQRIANEINKIFSDEHLLENLRTASQKAGKEMNWGVEEQKLLNIYQKLGHAYN